MKKKRQVKKIVFTTIKKQKFLSIAIFFTVIGAVIAALIPPLILAKMIDSITSGKKAVLSMILLYFVMLAVTGGMASSVCLQMPAKSSAFLL